MNQVAQSYAGIAGQPAGFGFQQHGASSHDSFAGQHYPGYTSTTQYYQPQNFTQTQGASPHARPAPNVANQQAFSPPQQQHTPPIRYPMAAPPLPHSPANPQQQAAGQGTEASSHSPPTPKSPATRSRDAQSVALLLEINLELLQEVSRLQSEGLGGACNPGQQAALKSQGQADGMASDEYINTMRRVQANLAYLMPKAQNDPAKTPPGPAHMTPPAHMPQLLPKYVRLRELFPGWHGSDYRPAQLYSSPRSNGVGGQQLPAPAAVAQA